MAPEVRTCLDRLVRAEWLQRRLAASNPILIEQKLASLAEAGSGDDIGAAYASLETTLQGLQVRINAAERNYRNALPELYKLREGIPKDLRAIGFGCKKSEPSL